MKQTKLLFIFLITTQIVFAQRFKNKELATIDKLALAIPDSLTTSTDKIAEYMSSKFSDDATKSRAIFIWVASNIQYDIANIYALNFYEKREEKVVKALKTRKGICEHYASLFSDICEKAGIKSYVIEGYTKQNGYTDYMPHAWNAALIDSSWYLFDPTWGSGFILDGRFIRKINNNYFMAFPNYFITSHMPFDYLWQCVTNPITNQEFYESKLQKEPKSFFNYNDSIRLYESQSHLEQIRSSAYRVEKNGLKNSMIFDRLQHLKLEIENERQSTIVKNFNSATFEYNLGIQIFNSFIEYRNKQFTPSKSDTAIQNILNFASLKFTTSKLKLAEIKNPNENLVEMINQLNKSIDDIKLKLEEQQTWLNTYFKKNKVARKLLFYERG